MGRRKLVEERREQARVYKERKRGLEPHHLVEMESKLWSPATGVVMLEAKLEQDDSAQRADEKGRENATARGGTASAVSGRSGAALARWKYSPDHEYRRLANALSHAGLLRVARARRRG